MKVLVVTNMYPSRERPSWGAFVKVQVDSIRKLGVEIDLLIINGYKSKLAYLWAIFRLYYRLFLKRYDVVHAHYGLCGIVARMQFITPVVVSFCGDDLYGHFGRNGKPSRFSMLLVFFHKMLSKYVDAVIVKSQRMNDILPIDNAKIIPNGVDFDLFRPMDKSYARQKLGLEMDKVYILFPYQKERIRKCYSLLKDAVNELKKKVSKPLEILEVKFRPISEMPYCMNASDVLVLTSFWEGSPNVIKEAMTVNLKIVSVDVGDVRDIIGDTCGCEIAKRSSVDIAGKILKVLSEEEKTNGRSNINWLRTEKIGKKVIEIYYNVAKKRQDNINR